MTLQPKQLATLYFWGIFGFATVLDSWIMATTYSDAFAIFVWLILYFVIYYWFYTDSLEYSPAQSLKYMVMVFSPMALLYYLFRYKGWRKAIVSLIKFSAYLLLTFAISNLFIYLFNSSYFN